MLPAPHIDGRSVPAMYQRGLTLIPCSLKYPSWSATANCEDICASRTSQASTSASSGFWAAAPPAPARTTSVASTTVRYRIAAPFGVCIVAASARRASPERAPLEGHQQGVHERAQHPEEEGAHDDLGRAEEHAALHDEVAEAGVGAHELGADDHEDREPEAQTKRHDDAGEGGRQHDAPQKIPPRRPEARGGAQQHHVDAQQARRDPDEHRKEGRVRDEGDLRRLAEAEPHEEHRQERERRDRAQELDERLDGEPRRRVERDGEAERQRGGGCQPEPRDDAARRHEHVARERPVARERDGHGGHLARGRQQRRVHDLHGAVPVRDGRPRHEHRRQRERADHACTLATSSFTSRVISLSYRVNSGANRSRASGSLSVKISLMRPGARVRTTTRSARYTASRIEWVTKMIVLCSTRWIRDSSSCITSRVCASSAPKGSSIRTMDGLLARARAIATRCFMPPESCTGNLAACSLSPTMCR